MPSQITHYLFAREVLSGVFRKRGEHGGENCPELVAWCSQGPDFFYHNQRTRPASFKYGRILHRGGYGRLIYNMLPFYYGAPKKDRDIITTIIFSFITHAVLDRSVHPFIIYFSGWREPGKPETATYYRMHPFFERILDVLHPQNRGINFFKTVKNIEEHYPRLREIMLSSIGSAYTNLHKPDLSPESFYNAYLDALFFYKVTNPRDRENVKHAYERDKAASFSRRLLALYFPRYFDPSIDYMNEAKKKWRNPFVPEQITSASYPELYNEALEKAAVIIEELNTMLSASDLRDIDKEEIYQLVGNGNLSNGSPDKSASPVVSDPLPLYEQLVREYRGVEKEFGLDQIFIHK